LETWGLMIGFVILIMGINIAGSKKKQKETKRNE